MSTLRPPTRRRARGLAALVAAGAAMGAFGGQALATETTVELPSQEDPRKGLEVKKSAHTYHAAYWKWDIEKSPDRRVGYNHEHYHVKVGYKVTATPKVVKTGSHTVYGKIYMRNPSKYRSIGILGIYDRLHGEDGAKCEIGPMHGGGSNGDNSAQEDNGVKGYLPPKSGGYVEYKCHWDGEPSSRVGKNKAVVKWAYGPRMVDVTAEPALTAEREAEMIRVKTTHAYAPYNFAEGEIDHRGYTSANVYDKMGKKGEPELIGEGLSALDGPWTKHYYKYLRAPRKVNECVVVKNRAILVGKRAESEPNGVEIRAEWGKVHADAYVKICTKEKKPSSEDPRPPDVVVSDGSSEDPRPDPKPDKPVIVRPTDDTPSSEDPRPTKGKLHVVKRANKKRAYVGSKVVWTIRVKNRGGKTLRNVHLKDVLPKYFRVEMKRTRKLMDRKKGVKLRGRSMNVRIGYIRPGQTRTIRIATRVVGRPYMDKPVRETASRKRGKARRAYIARMKRGIACNVVLVRAKGTRDMDRACVRVIKPKEGPRNERPSEENGEAAEAAV